jgi:signal peptidase I
MQPDINVGDMLIIQRQDKYNINDIVTYRSGSDLVTHRIIDISGSEVMTKGASNNVPDQPFQQSDIEGKLVLRIPMAGNAIFFLKSPFGILLVTVLLMLIIELPHVYEKRKLIKIGMSA